MKAAIYISLMAVVVAGPLLARRQGGAPAEAGGVRLVVVTPHNQDIRNEFARAFSAWHEARYGQAVWIDYRNAGGTSDIKRLLQTTYDSLRDRAGQLRAGASSGLDVVWGGGDFFFDHDLKPLGILRPLRLDERVLKECFPEDSLAGVRLYDAGRPPRWVGVCLSSFGMVYNPDLYAALGLPPPRTWSDLADPRLSGYVALADPTHSGSAAVAYMMVIQRAMADAQAANPGAGNAALAAGWKRGMGQLLLIACNARYFSDSSTQVPSDVGSGEAAGGMAIDFYARVYEETVGAKRLRFVEPAGATAITPDPVAVLSGGNEELGNRFVEFLLSPEGQRLWDLRVGTPGGPVKGALRRMPIRRDVYADRAGWADDVDPFAEAQGFNQRQEWMGTFADLQPIWAAAWIDGRDELLDAYRRILAVPDAARRQALLDQLADLPIEMGDVARIRAERRKQADVNLWNAEQRMEWTRKFCAHYEQVAERAGER